MLGIVRGPSALSEAFLSTGLLLCLPACDIGAGLQDVGATLGQSEPGRFEVGGRKIASGSFTEVTWVGSFEEGLRLAAFTKGEEARVRFIDYLGGTECDGGPAIGLVQLGSTLDELGAIVVWDEADEEERRGYRFIDTACQELLSPIQRSLDYGYSIKDGVAPWPFLLEDGTLKVLDILSRRILLELEDVVEYFPLGFTSWVLTADGKLRAYEESDFGSSRVEADDAQGFAFGEYASEFFIETTEGVRYQFINGESDLIEGACLSDPLGPLESRQIIVDPCGSEKRYLVLYDQESDFQAEDRSPRVPVLLPSELGPIVGVSYLSGSLLLEVAEGEGEGFRYYRVLNSFEEEVPRPGDKIEVELVAQHTKRLVRGEEGEAIVLSDFIDGRGRLQKLRGLALGEELVATEIASDVVWTDSSFCPGTLALIQSEDSSGDLVCLEEEDAGTSDDFRARTLAEGVGYQGGYLDPTGTEVARFFGRSFLGLPGGERYKRTGLLALVTGVKEERGNLELIEFLNDEEVGRTRSIAKGVLPWSAQPISSPAGVLYLTGDGKSSLRVALSDSDLDMKIADYVSHFEMLEYPSGGVLYIVDRGDDAGIWFASSR